MIAARGRFLFWLGGAAALTILVALWSFSVGRFPVAPATSGARSGPP
jgi:hypothetical protein